MVFTSIERPSLSGVCAAPISNISKVNCVSIAYIFILYLFYIIIVNALMTGATIEIFITEYNHFLTYFYCL